jgi:hypothetical protein
VFPNKDVISKPSKGRYFALSSAQLLRELKGCALKHSEYQKRVALELRNPSSESSLGQKVATFYPEDAVITYSFPSEFDSSRAINLIKTALAEFQKIDSEITTSSSRRENISYRIYMSDLNRMKVTRRVSTKTLGKYRGDGKFSNAFKAKKIDTFEEILREI